MSRFNRLERVAAVTALTIISLGAAACGENDGAPIDHAAEVARLQLVHDGAQRAVEDTLGELDIYLVGLPPACRAAIEVYRNNNSNEEVPTDDARAETAQWCGPDHLSAIQDIRALDNQAYDSSITVHETEYWIAANLAALGVKPGDTVPAGNG